MIARRELVDAESPDSGCRQDFRRGGVQGQRPELLTSPATGGGDRPKRTSSRLPAGLRARATELLTSPATGEAGSVVKTSGGAACKGDAPNS